MLEQKSKKKMLIFTLLLSNFSKPQFKFLHGLFRDLIYKDQCLPQYCGAKL